MPLLSAADLARICMSFSRLSGQRVSELVIKAACAKARNFTNPFPVDTHAATGVSPVYNIALQLLHHNENGGWRGCSRISCSDHSLSLISLRNRCIQGAECRARGTCRCKTLIGFGCRATCQLGSGNGAPVSAPTGKRKTKAKRGSKPRSAMAEQEQRSPTEIPILVCTSTSTDTGADTCVESTARSETVARSAIVSVAAGGGGYRHGLSKQRGVHDSAGFSIVLTSIGQVVSFGCNRYGKLGRVISSSNSSGGRRGRHRSSTSPSLASDSDLHQAVPRLIASLQHIVVTAVAAGAAHSLLVSASGQLFVNVFVYFVVVDCVCYFAF